MANDLLTVADFVADALDVDDTTTSEVLNASPLVARLPISDTSDGSETHKYNTYTGAPVVGFRAANAGRDYDHSIDTVVSAVILPGLSGCSVRRISTHWLTIWSSVRAAQLRQNSPVCTRSRRATTT